MEVVSVGRWIAPLHGQKQTTTFRFSLVIRSGLPEVLSLFFRKFFVFQIRQRQEFNNVSLNESRVVRSLNRNSNSSRKQSRWTAPSIQDRGSVSLACSCTLDEIAVNSKANWNE